MIRHGDTVTLEVTETNMLGNGVAKVGDMVVFCRGAVAGDVVTALVTDVKKNYAEAKCLDVVIPSHERRTSSCPRVHECGGCVFDGVSREHEIEVKKAGIAAAMRREGIRTEVSTFVTTESAGYRNKAVFHFDEDGRCGYFSAGSHDFARIEKCLICDEKINIIKYEAERAIAQLRITPSELTYLYIRYMRETDEASVALGYTGDASLSCFASELAEALPYVKSVFRGHERSPESRDEKFELVYGAKRLSAVVSGLKMSVSPEAFFQVNNEGAEALCEAVCRFADLKDGERAADIYCGTGLFGLALAASAPHAEVYGIELNEASVKNANENAMINGLANAFFLAGDSSELKSKTGIDSLDAAVVDPPRTGLSKKTISELLDLSPERIIYVSCNPSTLARDVKALSEHYLLKEVVGVDVFPRTKHVECVTLMTKK